MGLSDWRAKHNMRDPVRGVFRVTGFYDKHPSSNPPGTRVTGVITAPGIPATSAEHKVDERGRWASHQELPVLVDRADPSRFAILWSEVQNVSWRDSEMSSAQAVADQLNAAQFNAAQFNAAQFNAAQFNAAQPGFQPYVEQAPFPGPPGSQPGIPTYPGQPGYPQVQISMSSLPPDAAAALQSAVAQALGAAGLGQSQVLGAPGRPAPGMPGGGLTPEQAAQMVAGGGGERASAVVLDAREIAVPPGMPSAPAGMVDITLEIRRADGTRYTAVTRVGFSTAERRARVATPGTQLSVHIDPSDRSRVAIDTTGLF
jgi:hypothetical protein